MAKDIFSVFDGGLNAYARLVDDGLLSDDAGFIDTGSYVLNAAVSGSLFGGYGDNLITAIAGKSTTGKTFLCIATAKEFQDQYPDGLVVWFDSEFAVRKTSFDSKKLDPKRLKVYPVLTVEEFRHQLASFLDNYMAVGKESRPRVLFILDSIGNLSTSKEVGDMSKGEEKLDMTKAKLLKGAFRAVTLKIGISKAPLICTNHTYTEIGQMYPSEILTGGDGLRYCASNIIYLGKSKDKEDGEQVGIFVRCKMNKSRFSQENKEIQTKINFDTGLDRYHGLLELGEELGVYTKEGHRYVLEPGATPQFRKTIMETPASYFTREHLMKFLEPAIRKHFMYGSDYDLWEKTRHLAK